MLRKWDLGFNKKCYPKGLSKKEMGKVKLSVKVIPVETKEKRKEFPLCYNITPVWRT